MSNKIPWKWRILNAGLLFLALGLIAKLAEYKASLKPIAWWAVLLICFLGILPIVVWTYYLMGKAFGEKDGRE